MLVSQAVEDYRYAIQRLLAMHQCSPALTVHAGW